MIKDQRILALIPARGGSKGLKGKNTKILSGKPLIAWPIQVAQASQYVDKVVVSTDAENIAEIARQYQADVPFMRPALLASDTASSFDVIKHAIETLASEGEEFDYLLLLEPTSPLTQTRDIDLAIERLVNHSDNAKAIVGVCANEEGHPAFSIKVDQQGFLHPFQDSFQVLRRQELPSCFRYEGSLYCSDIKTLMQEQSFYHQATIGYLVPKWQAFEIDDLTDFVCIEAIMNNLTRLQASEPSNFQPSSNDE
jgi:N-acylneuraminate cytidylyltransferase/CMP-N,N'-diacetyllegionaminic acid synthase